MGELGVGLFELANESQVAARDPEARAEANARLRRLAVDTGVPVTFGVLGAADPQIWRDQLDLLDDTAAEGGRMFAQTHCRGVSVLLSFKTSLPFDRLPEWAELRALPLDAQAELLARPEVRERLVRAANEGEFGRAVGAEARKPRYDRIHVLERAHGRNPTLAELAESSGRDPVEIMIDLALESKFEVFFQQFPVKPDSAAIEAMLKHPRTAMTFSDSGAHVSQIMDSSIQTDLLAEWVRAREVFTLEEAVRMITYVPATLWGMADRGLIREGMAADLNVIDPDTIAPQLPELVADLPAGARRLVQKAQGIKATIVGGQTGAHRRCPDRRAAGPPPARPARSSICRGILTPTDQRVARSGLDVAVELAEFIDDEALPGSGVAPGAFWDGLAGPGRRLRSRGTRRCCRSAPTSRPPSTAGTSSTLVGRTRDEYREMLERDRLPRPAGRAVHDRHHRRRPRDRRGGRPAARRAGDERPVRARTRPTPGGARCTTRCTAPTRSATPPPPGPYDPARGARVIAWVRQFLDDVVPLRGALARRRRPGTGWSTARSRSRCAGGDDGRARRSGVRSPATSATPARRRRSSSSTTAWASRSSSTGSMPSARPTRPASPTSCSSRR